MHKNLSKQRQQFVIEKLEKAYFGLKVAAEQVGNDVKTEAEIIALREAVSKVWVKHNESFAKQFNEYP